MADTYKSLAQSTPAAATLTDAYTVPASTFALISSITVSNRGATSDVFRISVAIASAADATQQYLYFDVPILPNETFVLNTAFALGAADRIRVRGGTANLTFNIHGFEITGVPETYKILGQSAPAAATVTDIYTVPAGKIAVVGAIFACNRAAVSDTFRLMHAPGGAADANAHRLVSDLTILENDTYLATIGVTMTATDVFRVRAGTANMSFTIMGIEK